MSYYPEPDCHNQDKMKVILDFENYATKMILDHIASVDTSNLVARKILLI